MPDIHFADCVASAKLAPEISGARSAFQLVGGNEVADAFFAGACDARAPASKNLEVSDEIGAIATERIRVRERPKGSERESATDGIRARRLKGAPPPS